LGRVEEYSQEVAGTNYGDVIHYFLDTMLSLFACCRDYYNVVAWACADRVLHSHRLPVVVAGTHHCEAHRQSWSCLLLACVADYWHVARSASGGAQCGCVP
jgi:hypothetical protein